MNTRFVLQSPFGTRVERVVVDGAWQEPNGSEAEVFGAGLFALPGLVDAHAHLATAELNYQPGIYDEAADRARAALEAGVTLVLDKGWTDTTTIEVIGTVDPSQRPEIEAAARILANPGGYFPDFAHEVDPGDLQSAVAEEAKAGAGWVKLIGDWPRRGVGPQPNFTVGDLAGAVHTARSLGARTAIHTMARDVPSMAVSAGIDSIEHGLFMTDADVVSLGERNGMWVPTILRVEETVAQLGADSSGGRLLAEGLENLRRLLGPAIGEGVKVLAGTDLVGSPTNVVAEAKAMSRYGMSNTQIVESISVAAFEATGRSSSFEIGAPADCVFFDSDPIKDLDVLGHPKSVMRLGTLR